MNTQGDRRRDQLPVVNCEYAKRLSRQRSPQPNRRSFEQPRLRRSIVADTIAANVVYRLYRQPVAATGCGDDRRK